MSFDGAHHRQRDGDSVPTNVQQLKTTQRAECDKIRSEIEAQAGQGPGHQRKKALICEQYVAAAMPIPPAKCHKLAGAVVVPNTTTSMHDLEEMQRFVDAELQFTCTAVHTSNSRSHHYEHTKLPHQATAFDSAGNSHVPDETTAPARGNMQMPEQATAPPKGSLQTLEQTAALDKGNMQMPKQATAPPRRSAQMPEQATSPLRRSGQMPAQATAPPRGSAQMPEQATAPQRQCADVSTGNCPFQRQRADARAISCLSAASHS